MISTSKSYVFLLGGNDAEMEAIREILSTNNCDVRDLGLTWENAYLSAYVEELQRIPFGAVPVLIELKRDVPLPPNAMEIDHHDECAGDTAKTSLEQIAELLNIELDHEHRLISANDRGHIRSMLAMGASIEDIFRIRCNDRQAQGCTDKDCMLGEKAVNTTLREPYPGLATVVSRTRRSAHVVDRIWNRYQSIVISQPDNYVCVSAPGSAITSLKEYYQNLRTCNPSIQYWYGGNLPSYGYFGANHFDERSISMVAESTLPISQHIFLFPFRIVPWEQDNSDPVSIRKVFETLKSDGWEYKPFHPFESAEKYSQFGYFHEYVRTAIFEQSPMEKLFCDRKGGEPTFVSCELTRPFASGSFTLRIKGKQEYHLTLKGITLRLFETGIAILGLELLNYNYGHFDDVSRINDFGRRVYPQFLTPGPDGQGASMDNVKDAFLPDEVILEFDGKLLSEPFALDDFFIPAHDHQHIARYVIGLLGKKLTESYKAEPVIDDRMYTLCWYSSDDMVERMTAKDANETYAFESAEEWYRFIFLDGGDCMCPDKRFRKELIEASTYRRWAAWGTIYGVTRYSIVSLCRSGAPPFIREHMRSMYRRMAEILLAQRATIISFSSQVSTISRDIDSLNNAADDKIFRNIEKRVSELHGDFIGFMNRLWFEEVTPQEQGIEIYNMAVENMGLKNQRHSLKDELKELYEFVEMHSDRKQNNIIYNLTLIACVGIPITVTLAFWGISKEIMEFFVYPRITVVLSLSAAFIFGLYLIYRAKKES